MRVWFGLSVLSCSQLHSQQASSMPTWLSSSTQHCFSWLAAVPASRPTTGNSMALAAAIGEAPPTQLAAAAAADASAREVPAAAPCEAPDSEPGQKQADAATEVQQAMDTDLPPAKRGYKDYAKVPWISQVHAVSAKTPWVGPATTQASRCSASTTQLLLTLLLIPLGLSTCHACVYTHM